MDEALARLRAHPACAAVTYANGSFHVNEVPVRGLTRVLAAGMPVAPHAPDTCAHCSAPARARALGLCEPGPQSRKTERALVLAEPRRRKRVRVLGPPACVGGGSACEHGVVVEQQVAAYGQHGALARRVGEAVDPCAVSVAAHLEHRGWCLLASEPREAPYRQTYLHSRALRFATAVDMLCTDAATRSRLIVIELKATRNTGDADACYRARAAGAAGASHSYYDVHQAQLWAMVRTIEMECGERVHEAYVLRATPTCVHEYPLRRAYWAQAAHATRFAAMFAK